MQEHLLTQDEHKALLWRGVLEDTGNPALRVTLADIVRHYGVPTRDNAALSAAVQRFVQERIVYLKEAPETFVSSARTLEMGIADCDDMARLVASLLRSAQVPCRLTFAGWCKPPCERPPLCHVWAESWCTPHGESAPRWVALETVRPVPFGWECTQRYRDRGYSVRVEHLGEEAPVDPREHERARARERERQSTGRSGVRGDAGAVPAPGGPLRW